MLKIITKMLNRPPFTSLNVCREVEEVRTTICFMFYTWIEPVSYDLAPEEKLCGHSGLICAVRLKCVHSMMSHILTIRIKAAVHGGYRVLRRIHMLGLRAGTKPCLQKHLYEPAVFTQREFLQGVTWTPGSAHSLMSEKKKEKQEAQAIFNL